MSLAQKAWLIIDGYSLLYRDPECKAQLDRNLQFARQLLVRKIERIAPDYAATSTVVFDGKERGTGDAFDSPVEILFAPGHLTADTVIERLVHNHPNPETILVVTSDRMERQTVEGAGAETISCGDFLERGRIQSTSRSAKRAPRNSLGDFFPG